MWELWGNNFSRKHFASWHEISSFCAQSVEKMKQSGGPRAIRSVCVWEREPDGQGIFLSNPKQSPILTETAAGISRGTKKRISASHSLHCATASPQWWHSPRSVSSSFVLLFTTWMIVQFSSRKGSVSTAYQACYVFLIALCRFPFTLSTYLLNCLNHKMLMFCSKPDRTLTL